MFDKELMKQLTTIPVQNREEWFAERDKLETLAVEMTRINAKDMVQKYGIARVLRVLAATIKQNPNDYDADVVEMAGMDPAGSIGPECRDVVQLDHPQSIRPRPVSPVCEPAQAVRKEPKP